LRGGDLPYAGKQKKKNIFHDKCGSLKFKIVLKDKKISQHKCKC
jgi:hypothetical protein